MVGSLKEAREGAGMTQEALAESLGLTRMSVSHWEVGRAVPSGSARRLLAQVLELPLEVIESWFTREEKAA